MEYRKITEQGFEAWYDAGMTLVNFYVQIWESSNHFLLKEYTGKEQFYTMMQEKLQSFLNELGSTEDLSGVVYYVKEIKRVFATHLKNSTLTLERAWKLLFTVLIFTRTLFGLNSAR